MVLYLHFDQTRKPALSAAALALYLLALAQQIEAWLTNYRATLSNQK